jgi:hypothetical protein
MCNLINDFGRLAVVLAAVLAVVNAVVNLMQIAGGRLLSLPFGKLRLKTVGQNKWIMKSTKNSFVCNLQF